MKHEKSGDPTYLPLSPPLVTFLVSAEVAELEPEKDPPCPECGARSDEPGYHGHGMHCRRFYAGEAAG